MAFRRLVASSLTTDFKKACKIVPAQLKPLQQNEVLIKSCYVGINASDINVTAGRYGPSEPPFGVGFEGVGRVVDVGTNVTASMKGQSVAYITAGCFSEYITLPQKMCFSIPLARPEYVPLLVSGLTASISLDMYGRLKPGENVLVTAAAGGTGHIAVQLAKLAGCHVIGTCSTDEKRQFLKSIGCDDVINYKEENLHDVLKLGYPSGIDVAYESIGGDIFDACVNRLAVNGRVIALGYINSYLSVAGIDRTKRDSALIAKLLRKSCTVSGFFLLNHAAHYKSHFEKLVGLLGEGKLNIFTEQTDGQGKPFKGLESVFAGVDHLYSQKSMGKIVVDLSDHSPKL